MAADGGADSLISESYLAEQRRLHELGGYGVHGERWGDTVAQLVGKYAADDVLDYGCGAGALARHLTEIGIIVREYDPAVAGKDMLPESADVVVCADVMEHIELDRLKRVGQHLRDLTKKALFVAISTRLAGKKLSDGRNAHLIVRPGVFWRSFFEARGFAVKSEGDNSLDEYVAVLRPR